MSDFIAFLSTVSFVMVQLFKAFTIICFALVILQLCFDTLKIKSKNAIKNGEKRMTQLRY